VDVRGRSPDDDRGDHDAADRRATPPRSETTAVPQALTLPLDHPALVFIVLFVVILFAPIAARRVGAPGIIGLIIAGVLVGPHTFGILEREGMIELLGEAGLLYLMFLIGLDLDRSTLNQNRRGSMIFTAATFAIPMVLVTGAGAALGMTLVGAIIVASAFTSHTPVTYPLVQRFGLVRSRTVTITLAATLLATTAALLVFSVVVASAEGAPSVWFWIQFTVALGVFIALTLRGLPRLTRWFFSGLGQDRLVRFLFVLVVLFAMAALGEITGIQAIVGAFLAGLAIERFIPEGSLLRERIDFLGDVLLVPIFLVSTGMLVDPVALVTDLDRLTLGVGLTVAAIAAKVLASWVTAAILDLDRPDRGVMTSLTVAQAAGALAVVLVAYDLELVTEAALDATILVILVSCLTASMIGSRAAPRMMRPGREKPPLGRTIVVPIANPHSVGPLVDIAGLMALPDSGEVIAVNVLGNEASREQLEEHREATERAEQRALSQGAEARSIVRIDSSPSEGVIHAVTENDATCLLLGWKGYTNRRENFFGGVIDAVLDHIEVPAIVCRPGTDERTDRIVLVVDDEDLTAARRIDLQLSASVAKRLAAAADVPLLVLTVADDEQLHEVLDDYTAAEFVVDPRDSRGSITDHTRPGDLVVVGTPPVRPGLGPDAERIARAVPDRTVIVTLPR
jgi:Kef-type K+ transport system membrane component KefB/nucleotide-binding universal stress UspA family protein